MDRKTRVGSKVVPMGGVTSSVLLTLDLSYDERNRYKHDSCL